MNILLLLSTISARMIFQKWEGPPSTTRLQLSPEGEDDFPLDSKQKFDSIGKFLGKIWESQMGQIRKGPLSFSHNKRKLL